MRRFGFGTPTGVDLPGEEAGIVLTYDDYSGSTAANMAMGQGLAVTPMQMGAAYAAIANGGILRAAAHRRRRSAAASSRSRRASAMISEQTAASVRRMLEGVLGPGGTATGAKIDGYELGGKTGTAEKPDETGGYSKDKFIASFVGFAPAAHPRLLVAVMVDEPQGRHLRRHRRRPGVQGHRVLRAHEPPDPARSSPPGPGRSDAAPQQRDDQQPDGEQRHRQRERRPRMRDEQRDHDADAGSPR